MCTLVVRFAPGTPFPLCVAANRDERLSRRSSPPQLWPGELRFLAPRDEEKGGTWLGLNANGVFVGVTNRFGVAAEPSRLSRGQLVLDALQAPSAEALHQRLRELPPTRHNAFHLLYADARTAHVTWSDGTAIRQDTLGPGVHIVTERSLGGDDRARTEFLRATWDATIGDQLPAAEHLEALLQLHDDENPAGGTCVHIPSLGYGTKSGMVLRIPERLAEAELLWAEGPPCETAFVDQTALVRALVEKGDRLFFPRG